MDERFDRIERIIGELGQSLGSRIDGVEQGLGGRIDGVEHRMASGFEGLGSRIDGVEQRLDGRIDGLGNKLDDVERRLRGHIECVEEKVDDVGVRVGVLHEDVKRDFRFSLEALQGIVEQIDRRFEAQAGAFRAELAPIRDAVKGGRGAARTRPPR